MTARKHFELNDNKKKNITCHNVQDAAQSVIQGNFIESIACIF